MRRKSKQEQTTLYDFKEQEIKKFANKIIARCMEREYSIAEIRALIEHLNKEVDKSTASLQHGNGLQIYMTEDGQRFY